MTPVCDVCDYEMRDRPRPGVEQWILTSSGSRVWVCAQHIETAEQWFSQGPWS
jgi:hypothetical protein